MIAEIVSIGTELLMGQIANTDAQYLASQFCALGIDGYHQSVVGDNAARAKAVLAQALERSDLVITSGGLGPTLDDMTKEIVADLWGLPMVEHEPSVRALETFFSRLGRSMTPNNLRQAQFPAGCTVLPNARGTAPGCIVERDGKAIIILPGPPHELQGMWEDSVLPWLEARSDSVLHCRWLHVLGIGESDLETQLRDLIDAQDHMRASLAMYATGKDILLRLAVKCAKGEDPTPEIEPLAEEIYRRLGAHIYAEGMHASLADVIVGRLAGRGQTLSVAESCTGGMVASMIVGVPGASDVLIEGHVTYANQAKVRVLGVREEDLAAHGAVSEVVARQMAEGARAVSGSTYALSTTGIAGPGGGTPEKPVGLVYIACASERCTAVRELRMSGSRERIRTRSALSALDLLREVTKD